MGKKLIVTIQLEIDLNPGTKPDLQEVAGSFDTAVNANPKLAQVAWDLGTYLNARVTNVTKINSLDV